MPRPYRAFLAMYRVEPNGCWIFTGRINARGRTGCVNYGGRKIAAYRAFYLAHVGPITDGLELDHLCRDPRCVNPAHLEPVTGRENRRRDGTIRLTESDVAAIKTALMNGERPTEIARKYGVVPSAISEISAGRSWRDVEAYA